jgi:hypothetical protein
MQQHYPRIIESGITLGSVLNLSKLYEKRQSYRRKDLQSLLDILKKKVLKASEHYRHEAGVSKH